MSRRDIRNVRSRVAPALAGALLAAVLVGASEAESLAVEPAARAPAQYAYRAVAELTVNERLPELTGECRSTGSRAIAWRAAVGRVSLIVAAGQATLATLRFGSGRFETFQSRVVSPCPGAFDNRFGGTPFRVAVTWNGDENVLRVDTLTEPLDEGEGAGWTHKGCTPGGRTSDGLELGGSPHYTSAETTLTAAERRALLARRAVRVRRSIDRVFPSSACGFGGDHFRVIASLDVRLTPARNGADGGAGGGCSINGTSRADVLRGTSGPDAICGLGGDDVIRGLGGNDRLRGGAGNDRLFGGPGADALDGGAGADRLTGEAGNDAFSARDGARDTVSGGAGRDSGLVDRRLDRVAGVEVLRPSG